ncbi:MAG TPA: NADH-quinone oxidoreductase subunit F, partial [Candidatus Limnocylindria bacterium]
MANTISPQIRILSSGEPRLLTDIGRIDPTSLASYREHGGYAALERAITKLSPEEVIREIEAAGLRGRGGSGFPTAAKWRAARAAAGERRIVVANVMGADPSALGDRALAEGNPHLVVEGLLIAAYAAGASEAIIAIRGDWTDAVARLRTAAEEATAARFAGYLVLGTDTSIQLSVWEGSGAYVAGEETALLNALA